MKKCIICDLDNTLSDARHREHYIVGPKKDFESFNRESVKDEPNTWCLKILECLEASHKEMFEPVDILFVTGRPARFADMTVEWLNKHVKGNFELFMRGDDDYRPAAEVKRFLYETYIKPEYDVVFALDDDPDVVAMWRSIGVVCLAHAPAPAGG